MNRFILTILYRIINYILSVKIIDLNKIYAVVLQKIEKKEKMYITGHKRPMFSENMKILPQKSKHLPSTAIILQGPILKENNFTVETVLFYLNNFNSSLIVVSTWDDEDKFILDQLRELGAVIVLSSKPAIPGISNINFQITTSINGILKAKELGAVYVMKSRTDQRIYGLNVIDYFINLIKLYPLEGIQVQQERLIVPNINTFLFRLYGVSDMTMFGNIDDMILYWNAEHDNRLINRNDNFGLDLKSFGRLRACEIYLCTEFLKKTQKDIKWTIEDSWKVFASNFCIVDYHSIDLYWPKYLPHTEFRNKYYFSNNTHQLVSFADWLSLYNNAYNLPSEGILNCQEGQDFFFR